MLIEGRIIENYLHYVMMVAHWILKKCKCILDLKASKGMFVKEAKGLFSLSHPLCYIGKFISFQS